MSAAGNINNNHFSPMSLAAAFESKMVKRTEYFFNLINKVMPEYSRRILLKVKPIPTNPTLENIKDVILDSKPASDKIDKNYIVTIPFLMLLKTKDFQNKGSFFSAIIQFVLSKVVLSDKEEKNLTAFFKIISLEKTFKKVIKFIFCHELGHIFNGDLERNANNNEDSQEREIMADKMAVKLLGTSIGAKTLFKIYAELFPNIPEKTHPSFEKRLKTFEMTNKPEKLQE